MNARNARIAAAEDGPRLGHEGRKTWAAAGSILGAVAASSCCILPLVLFSLGAGGAWIGNLTALAPFQPLFVAVTLGFLGYGYWFVYRKPKAACAEGGSLRPADARPDREAGSVARLGTGRGSDGLSVRRPDFAWHLATWTRRARKGEA